MTDISIPALHNIATQLRIDSVRSTSEAGSGHPTSCCSAADIMAALFFARDAVRSRRIRRTRDSDRFVLSKGHAAPILYAAWAEAGAFDRARAAEAAPNRLRSRRAPDAAAAVRRRRDRIARPGHLRRDRHRAQRAPHRVRLPHLRAARRRRDRPKARCGKRPTSAAIDKLDNLCGITDVNALGQSRPTMWEHDMEAVRAPLARVRLARHRHRRPRHRRDPRRASPRRARTKGRPTMILARTIKGKGVSFVEGKDGWHGKAFKKGEELDQRARRAREAVRARRRRGRANLAAQIPKPRVDAARRRSRRSRCRRRPTSCGDQVATREAYGTALAKLGEADPRVVALDADVKNSTFSEKFEKALPDRFYRELHRRAGDGRRGDGAGGARRDSVPVDVRLLPDARRRLHPHGGDQQRRTSSWPARTPACRSARTARRRWRSRISRCAAPSRTSRCSIRATRVSAERLVALMALPPGPGLHAHEPAEDAGHLRERRDVHRSADLKVLRESASDVATVVGAGVTVFEALKAYDQLKAAGIAIRVIDLYSVQPIDRGGARRGRPRDRRRI